MSYMFSESERYIREMPPNEIDSVWASAEKKSKAKQSYRFYYGHIFLVGIQCLRILARISGFKIKKLHRVRSTNSSVIWSILFYPLITLVNLVSYFKNMRRQKKRIGKEKLPKDFIQQVKSIYREQLRYGLASRCFIGAVIIY